MLTFLGNEGIAINFLISQKVSCQVDQQIYQVKILILNNTSFFVVSTVFEEYLHM
jgi:hypothetical protein